MKRKEVEKLGAAVALGASIATGGFITSERVKCDYEVQLDGGTVCVSETEMQAVINNNTWESGRTWEDI